MVGFFNETYGKFIPDIVDVLVIMEYGVFLPHIKDYLPRNISDNADFKQFL